MRRVFNTGNNSLSLLYAHVFSYTIVRECIRSLGFAHYRYVGKSPLVDNISVESTLKERKGKLFCLRPRRDKSDHSHKGYIRKIVYPERTNSLHSLLFPFFFFFWSTKYYRLPFVSITRIPGLRTHVYVYDAWTPLFRSIIQRGCILADRHFLEGWAGLITLSRK